MQLKLRPLAITSMVLHALGVPLVFAFILYHFRREISEDQLLRQQGTGNSRSTNPNYHIRQRFQKLYRFECRARRAIVLCTPRAVVVVCSMLLGCFTTACIVPRKYGS
jgi:hypothetical protein